MNETPGGRRAPLGVVLALGGIVGVVASLIFPCRTRRSTLETCSVGSCHAYAEAQIMYKRRDWNKDGELEYAHPFPVLHHQKDENGEMIQLIDSSFAKAVPGGPPKHGYNFRDMKTIGGKSIDWKKDFALCATPSYYRRTGYRTFIATTDGTVWGKDFGKSAFLDDFPADPGAEGWHKPNGYGKPGFFYYLFATLGMLAGVLALWPLACWLRHTKSVLEWACAAALIIGILAALVWALLEVYFPPLR